MTFAIETLDSGAWRLLCERCAPPFSKRATPEQLAALCGMESARCDVCRVSEDEGDD